MHNHKHFHEREEKSDTKNIKIVFFMNLIFMIVEIIGGFLTNSMAVMSDAVHDFGDCVTLAMNWFLEEYSVKQDDEKIYLRIQKILTCRCSDKHCCSCYRFGFNNN